MDLAIQPSVQLLFSSQDFIIHRSVQTSSSLLLTSLKVELQSSIINSQNLTLVLLTPANSTAVKDPKTWKRQTRDFTKKLWRSRSDSRLKTKLALSKSSLKLCKLRRKNLENRIMTRKSVKELALTSLIMSAVMRLWTLTE